MAMDHDWGPGLTFIHPPEAGALATSLLETFLRTLPPQVAGFPTRFRAFEEEPGTLHMAIAIDDECST